MERLNKRASARARVKVGLLGAGYIVDSHAAALTAIPSVQLHAVCDTSRSRAQRAASKYAIPHVLTSMQALAASDCEVVHVLLPPPLHLDAALAMVDAGKSVFLEKPMGLDSAACAALATRAAARGVAVGVNHNFLFSRSYEALRAAVKRGELGALDQIQATWHFALPLLQFGPFDSWPLTAPANLLFELGSHLAAFLVDLMGEPTVVSAEAGNAVEIPGGRQVYRHWTAVLRSAATTAVWSLSVTPGHPTRSLQVRGRGGSAQLDFGRDLFWRNVTVTDNPIFDALATAKETGSMLVRQARADRIRRLRAALAKRPDANPFEESVFRSIQQFYRNGTGQVDPRHSGHFGAQVIGLCEAIASAAGAGAPSTTAPSVPMPRPHKPPTVLVVGGTGFIGRRLVRQLIERGHSVRLLTRNARAAALEFDGAPVELFAGSHGDREGVQAALEGIESVYHLAKCEGKRWADYVEGDIAPTRVLAEAALAAGVRRFIYTGTIASYASGNPRAVIDHRTPLDPRIASRSHYARSKAACEVLLQSLHRERGLPLVIARPAVVLGVGSPPMHLGVARFASETRVQFWGDGRTPLPLVLVDDVADALVRALEVPGIEGQAFLLTSPPLLTARDYVQALAEHMRTRIDARSHSAWHQWGENLVKELAKHAVRHPNRRWPTLHDERCYSHCARFDASMSEQILDWHPVSDRETMIARGIVEPLQWYLR
jgi:predicted dehydrogenase/nucleoside-diphosphate-sugar epimerase